jgi:hypothetical protein
MISGAELLMGTTVTVKARRRLGEIIITGRAFTISGGLNPVEKSQMTMDPTPG